MMPRRSLAVVVEVHRSVHTMFALSIWVGRSWGIWQASLDMDTRHVNHASLSTFVVRHIH